jgi:hypothetical protein
LTSDTRPDFGRAGVTIVPCGLAGCGVWVPGKVWLAGPALRRDEQALNKRTNARAIEHFHRMKRSY